MTNHRAVPMVSSFDGVQSSFVRIYGSFAGQ